MVELDVDISVKSEGVEAPRRCALRVWISACSCAIVTSCCRLVIVALYSVVSVVVGVSTKGFLPFLCSRTSVPVGGGIFAESAAA